MHVHAGVHLRGGKPPLEQIWPPLEHTGFTPVSNSCYKKPHLFIVCPPLASISVCSPDIHVLMLCRKFELILIKIRFFTNF